MCICGEGTATLKNSFKKDKNENDGTVAMKKWTPWLPNDYEVSEKPAFLVKESIGEWSGEKIGWQNVRSN